METTEKKDALRREKLELNYAIYRRAIDCRRANHPAEELLDEYEKKFMLLVLLAFDTQVTEPEFSGCTISDKKSRDWFSIGYAHAQVAALSILSDKNAIADRYASFIDEFEKEKNIPEEE